MNNYAAHLQLLLSGLAKFPHKVVVTRDQHRFGVRCDSADYGKLIGKGGQNIAMIKTFLDHRRKVDGETARANIQVLSANCERTVAAPKWSKEDWNGSDTDSLCKYFQCALEAITGSCFALIAFDSSHEQETTIKIQDVDQLQENIFFAFVQFARAVGRGRGRRVVIYAKDYPIRGAAPASGPEHGKGHSIFGGT